MKPSEQIDPRDRADKPTGACDVAAPIRQPRAPTSARKAGNQRGPLWRGPPGLTPKEKKCWSEKQRQRRPDVRIKEKRRLAARPAHLKTPEQLERQAERRFRFRRAIAGAIGELIEGGGAGFWTLRHHQTPAFRVQLPDGSFTIEEWETPEQLEKRFGPGPGKEHKK